MRWGRLRWGRERPSAHEIAALTEAPSEARGEASVEAGAPALARPHFPDPWPGVCDHFALQLLVLAEQVRPELDRLEADENDADRLQRLYQVDHAVTRMRRAARDMRILAGSNEELAGHTTSLIDVIRMAQSAIDHYTQVSIATVADLAVVPYVADDVASLLAALLDNATRYSPSTVTISAHLLDTGGVMFRIEDAGIGITPEQVAALNTTLAGRIPDVGHHTGRHTGFPVVHRLASRHGVGVRLACRPSRPSGPAGGTLAMVTVPPQLLCEVPTTGPAYGPAHGPAHGATPSTMADRPAPTAVPRPAPRIPPEDSETMTDTVNGLPRRRRTSLRGVEASGRASASQPPAPDPAAARRSFAEDVSAFTAGGQSARWEHETSPDESGDRTTEQEP